MDKIIYYLYHIPGKKIGVTRDLNNRVTKQQGYFPDEYEVLDHSDDIDYISKREIELQQSYGYKIDRQLYKNLYMNKIKSETMNINATEQTSTFPVPVSKLKGRLMDNLGKTWETMHGRFEINKNTVDWIMKNVTTSMYTTERCYIYNKAFFEKFVNKNLKQAKVNAKEATDKALDQIEAMKAELISHSKAINSRETYQDLEVREKDSKFDLIRAWATERGLYHGGDTKTQYCKLMEEAGELGRAILKEDNSEFVDAIGDMVVVLTNLAHLGGVSIEHCIESAYNEIKNRKGKMKNGTFVKNG